jgi:hypothetical protein
LRGNLLGGRRAVLGGGVMSFEETFEQDTVFISMRFPYTYGYNEAFLNQLAQDHPWVKAHNVGKSKGGGAIFASCKSVTGLIPMETKNQQLSFTPANMATNTTQVSSRKVQSIF